MHDDISGAFAGNYSIKCVNYNYRRKAGPFETEYMGSMKGLQTQSRRIMYVQINQPFHFLAVPDSHSAVGLTVQPSQRELLCIPTHTHAQHNVQRVK